MRKAPQVAMLEDRERHEGQNLDNGNNLLKRTVDRMKGERESAFKHRSLVFLEKVTRRFKVIFLKLENVFNSWNESIRQKRKTHLKERGEILNQKQAQDVLEKVREYKSDIQDNRKMGVRSMDTRPSMEMPVEEKYTRPMISDRIVSPQMKRRVETKDRLENILIERIAANPKDTEAYERLGEYYFEIENYNHAKECFKQVIKLNPSNEEAKNRMKKLERLLAR
jgi:tetratricopeptide (TPR) repeat protein